jgi:DnaJ-class molecular chaperone
MGNLTTGISYVCNNCQGSGLALDPRHDPACTQCHGTRDRPVMDCMNGSYDGSEPCTCHAVTTVEVA